MTIGGKMLRDKCGSCGSTDIYHGRLLAQAGVSIGSAVKFFSATNAARAMVCITCGGIEPYLDDTGIAKVREWKAAESGQVLPPGERGGRGIGLHKVLIFLAIVAALAAAFLSMWNVAQNLK